jgi:hypothetical protein
LISGTLLSPKRDQKVAKIDMDTVMDMDKDMDTDMDIHGTDMDIHGTDMDMDTV